MKNTKNIFKALFFSIKEVYTANPLLFILSLLITIISGLLSYVVMYNSKLIINLLQDIYTGSEKMGSVIPLIIFSAAIVFLSALIGWINSIVTSRQRFNFSKYIDERFIKKNAQLDIAFFDTPQYYNTLEEAERSKNSLNFIVYRVIHFFSFAVSLSISSYVIFTYKDKYVGLIIILFVLPALFNKGKYYKKLYQYDVDNRPLSRKISYCARILLDRNASKKIRFFNLKDYLLRKYSENTENQIEGKKKIIYKDGFIDSMTNTLPQVGVMIAMLIVTKNILFGEGQVGDFVYLMGILPSSKTTLQRWSRIYQSSAKASMQSENTRSL